MMVENSFTELKNLKQAAKPDTSNLTTTLTIFMFCMEKPPKIPKISLVNLDVELWSKLNDWKI